LRLQDRTQYTEGRRLSRRIAKAIKADRKKRTRDTGEVIESLLEKGNLKGAWRSLQGWYRNASGKGSKPAHDDLEKLVVEYSALYTRTNPPGEPIPILVAPFDVDGEVPKEGEIEDTVERLKLDKAPGLSGIESEHLKMWSDASKTSKDPDPVKWNKFVELVQRAFATEELPAEISWSVLVVIPKGCGSFRGIGLLEVIWKVIFYIIDSRLNEEIEFDD
jgi:hypothetical protein